MKIWLEIIVIKKSKGKFKLIEEGDFIERFFVSLYFGKQFPPSTNS